MKRNSLKIYDCSNISENNGISLICYIDPFLLSVNPRTYLSMCFNVLKKFIYRSYTNNSYSRVIQSLFIQQIKLTHAFSNLMQYKYQPGQESLIRAICEIYIRIKWLLNSSKPGIFNPVNKDKFTKYIRYSTQNLIINHVKPGLKYISNSLHKAMTGELNKLSPEQLMNNLNKVTRDMIDSTNNFKRLHQVGVDTHEKNLETFTSKKHLISIKFMTRDFPIDYKIYGGLCNETHSYISFIKDNVIEKGEKYFVNDKQLKYNNNNFLFIGYDLLFLTYTFHVIYKHNIFINKQYQGIPGNVDYFMKLFNKDSKQIICHSTTNAKIISYIKEFKW